MTNREQNTEAVDDAVRSVLNEYWNHTLAQGWHFDSHSMAVEIADLRRQLSSTQADRRRLAEEVEQQLQQFDWSDPQRDALRTKVLRMLRIVEQDAELYARESALAVEHLNHGVELFAATTRNERADEGDDLLWVAAIMDATQRGEIEAPIISCANPAYPFDFSLRLTAKGRAAIDSAITIKPGAGGGGEEDSR